MLKEPATGFPPDVVASYRLNFLQRALEPTLDLRLPENVVEFLTQQISPIHRLSEHLGGLFVDDAVQPIAFSLPYLGYLGQVKVDHHLLLGPGPFLRAAGLILFHHQPTGQAKPTRRDLDLARRVRDAGEIVRLRLLDVILTGEGDHWTSLKRQGRLKLPALGDDIKPLVDGRCRVKPKYRNPERPQETWSGRGNMASWLREKIGAGGRLEDFLVEG